MWPISVNNVQRHLVKGTLDIKKTVSCTYKIRFTTNELIVCKIAFCFLFGIGKSLLDRLIHNIKNNRFH